jgi:hypothetical protein
MSSWFLRGCAVASIIFILLCSGCIAPPRENTGDGQTPAQGNGPGTINTPTPDLTPEIIETQFLTPVTPYPKDEFPTPRSTYSNLPYPTPIIVEYMTIYNNELALKYNTVAYEYILENPPLMIDICIIPRMVTRNIWYVSPYGSRDEKTVTQTSVSQSAWFEVVVREKDTGIIVEKDGFGKTYSSTPKRELQVRSSGNYVIEFTGNDVNASIQMRIQKAGNETGGSSTPLTCPNP